MFLEETMSQAEQANKAVVRRLIAEVLNGGRLEAIDELYTPELAPAARRWITPFRASFPDVHMEVVDLIAEGDKVVEVWQYIEDQYTYDEFFS